MGLCVNDQYLKVRSYVRMINISKVKIGIACTYYFEQCPIQTLI